MNQYAKIKVVGSHEVDNLVNEGWEIVDKSKTMYDHDSYSVNYHMGYPYARRVEDLISIIKDYEENDLKSVLLDKIAETNNDSVDKYELDAYHTESKTPTASYMNRYRRIVEGDSSLHYVEKATARKHINF